ncbi:hypothetical protein AN958_01614 [Leucoagaricus sp. SymC.cos]|nr:hypothetical protein AN958_01614 [Leucoagaricus sp. SymC.cos]
MKSILPVRTIYSAKRNSKFGCRDHHLRRDTQKERCSWCYHMGLAREGRCGCSEIESATHTKGSGGFSITSQTYEHSRRRPQGRTLKSSIGSVTLLVHLVLTPLTYAPTTAATGIPSSPPKASRFPGHSSFIQFPHTQRQRVLPT